MSVLISGRMFPPTRKKKKEQVEAGATGQVLPPHLRTCPMADSLLAWTSFRNQLFLGLYRALRIRSGRVGWPYNNKEPGHRLPPPTDVFRPRVPPPPFDRGEERAFGASIQKSPSNSSQAKRRYWNTAAIRFIFTRPSSRRLWMGTLFWSESTLDSRSGSTSVYVSGESTRPNWSRTELRQVGRPIVQMKPKLL